MPEKIEPIRSVKNGPQLISLKLVLKLYLYSTLIAHFNRLQIVTFAAMETPFFVFYLEGPQWTEASIWLVSVGHVVPVLEVLGDVSEVVLVQHPPHLLQHMATQLHS